MKAIFISIFICTLTFYSNGQGGYSQHFDFGQKAMGFYNNLLVEDTLIVFGRVYNEDHPQWGLVFLKMDTLGNLFDMKMYFDPNDQNIYFEQGAEAIKTSDGGYILVGQYLGGNLKIFKLDVDGNIEFDKTYSDASVLYQNLLKIIEVDDGYIAMGRKQNQNYKRKGYLFKIDFEGNVLWTLDYGEPNRNEGFISINQLASDSILVRGGWSTDVQEKRFNMILNLEGDIIGYEEQDYVSLANFYAGPFLLLQNEDNSWNYLGNHVLNNGITQGNNPYIGKMDEDYNVLWRTDFGKQTNYLNTFLDMVKTSDGGIVGTGRYVTEIGAEGTNYLGGFTGKVNAEGDSLWSRVDTSFYSVGATVENYLIGVVALPSGSTISCGVINNYLLDPPQSFGWLVKIDKDGCIHPECNPSIDGVNMTPMVEAFDLYPNPVEDVLHIHGLDRYDIEIYGLKGKKYISKTDLTETADIDVRHLIPGIYFLKMKKGNQYMTKQFIKK